MARFHKGIAYGAAGLLGVGIFGSWAVGKLYNGITGEEEPKEAVQVTGFDVKVDPAPEPPKEEKPREKMTLTERVQERQQKEEKRQPRQQPKQTLQEKWLEKVNSGGMYAFGEDNGYAGTSGSENDCSTTRPYRVRALMADSATTDEPGMAIAFTSVDIQGTDSNGEYCVVIPEYSLVTVMVGKAGEYATNRAPAQVDTIYIESDGFQVKVDQPAKHINGIPGIVGEADHHTMSKVIAGTGSVLFQVVNNLTSALSFRANTVTNPVEDTLRKKLERPSEIKLNGEVFEFDLMPTSTPGYSS